MYSFSALRKLGGRRFENVAYLNKVLFDSMFYNACLKTILSIIYKNTIDSFTNEIILGADVKNGKEVKFKLALNLTSFKAGTSCTPEFVKVMSIYLRSLRSKRFQSSYSAKVRAFPLPPRSFFFLLSSQFSRRTRAETLAMQANIYVYSLT